MADKLTLREFHAQLGAHDWHFDYSDDHSVWRSGFDNRARLEVIAKQSTEHAKLYSAWSNHVLRGGPKPEIPPDE